MNINRTIKIGDMTIDKDKDIANIWYEDASGNKIQDNHKQEIPEDVTTYHVCFPLMITEKVYSIIDDEAGEKCVSTNNVHIDHLIGGENAPVIMAMVESGDFTLSEALYVWANACERCMNVITNYYTPFDDDPGYPMYSKEWHDANTECEFCKDCVDPRLLPKKESTQKTSLWAKIKDLFNLHIEPVVIPPTPEYKREVKFEIGKYYKHTSGSMYHICGRANSDLYYNPCLVAEDECGNIAFVGNTLEYAENYHEISKDDFLDKLDDKEELNVSCKDEFGEFNI